MCAQAALAARSCSHRPDVSVGFTSYPYPGQPCPWCVTWTRRREGGRSVCACRPLCDCHSKLSFFSIIYGLNSFFSFCKMNDEWSMWKFRNAQSVPRANKNTCWYLFFTKRRKKRYINLLQLTVLLKSVRNRYISRGLGGVFVLSPREGPGD